MSDDWSIDEIFERNPFDPKSLIGRVPTAIYRSLFVWNAGVQGEFGPMDLQFGDEVLTFDGAENADTLRVREGHSWYAFLPDQELTDQKEEEWLDGGGHCLVDVSKWPVFRQCIDTPILDAWLLKNEVDCIAGIAIMFAKRTLYFVTGADDPFVRWSLPPGYTDLRTT